MQIHYKDAGGGRDKSAKKSTQNWTINNCVPLCEYVCVRTCVCVCAVMSKISTYAHQKDTTNEEI